MRRRLLLTTALLIVLSGVGLAAWLGGRPFAYLPVDGEAADATVGAEVPLDDELDDELAAPAPVILVDAGPDGEVVAPLPPLTPPSTETRRTPSFRDTANYLLVGVDHTRGDWGRADSLIVAVFDDETGHVGLVSIPRDLYVEVPDHGPARVNAVLRIARRQERDPLEVMRRVVEDTLALHLDHVVAGDLDTFERTVDALGGVTVDVPCPIVDNFLDPRTETGRRLLDVAPGTHRFDGATAAMYVRSRHGRSDWDRARRQQAVLFGLRDRVRELGPTEWVPVLGEALEQGVVTSMSRLEMIALARRVSRLAPERIHGLVLGHRTMQSFRTPENRAVQLPDFAAMDEALEGLFSAPSPGALPRHARCQEADVAVRRTRGLP